MGVDMYSEMTTTLTRRRAAPKKSDPPCVTCGMVTNDPGEYHPYTFCQLYKAGIHPWQFLANVLWDRGWEKQSVEILDRFNVRDMSKRALKGSPHARPVNGEKP